MPETAESEIVFAAVLPTTVRLHPAKSEFRDLLDEYI